ncbi:MAG TPA: toll/interleukin-1 receptor domain-containing protein [Solirubrobacterales bacterium]|nr:toll/interleukin-1 receptor domain-containing protein [Solirubrobacterales bacterium]
MKIGLYADNTLALDLSRLCETLNSCCESLEFVAGVKSFRLLEPRIASPSDDSTLSKDLLREAEEFDLACLATNVPYDNNHFFDSRGSNTIISFAGWNRLTDLSISNGFVYFIASILVQWAEIGDTHHENTGCINDYWWDKKDVDVGMRAAFLCGECLRKRGKAGLPSGAIEDIERLLNIVSTASRANANLLDLPVHRAGAGEREFDVFLSHNSADKPAVRRINQRMKAAGIRTWLDEEQLRPGSSWQAELEAVISRVGSACVFVGGSGHGPWQVKEIRAFLEILDTNNRPIIPVLLPDAGGAPELPIFLRQRMWLDLRDGCEDELSKLIGFLADPSFYVHI